MSDAPSRDEFARYVPWAAAAVVVVAAVPIGVLRGAPGVVLWVAFALLAAAVVLFWEAMRTALDPAAPGDDPDADDEGVPSELEARKRAALQALRDIEFERSIGRLSEEDYKELEKKYRAEARAAMQAIDAGLGVWLSRAEAMLADVESAPVDRPGEGETKPATAADEGATAKPAPEPEKADAREETRGASCPKCETGNDADAVFCKKCGTRLNAEADHAS